MDPQQIAQASKQGQLPGQGEAVPTPGTVPGQEKPKEEAKKPGTPNENGSYANPIGAATESVLNPAAKAGDAAKTAAENPELVAALSDEETKNIHGGMLSDPYIAKLTELAAEYPDIMDALDGKFPDTQDVSDEDYVAALLELVQDNDDIMDQLAEIYSDDGTDDEAGADIDVVDTTDGVQEDEEDTLYDVISALPPDKQASLINRLVELNPAVKAAKIGDRYEKTGEQMIKGASLQDDFEGPYKAPGYGSNALAKLIASRRF